MTRISELVARADTTIESLGLTAHAIKASEVAASIGIEDPIAGGWTVAQATAVAMALGVPEKVGVNVRRWPPDPGRSGFCTVKGLTVDGIHVTIYARYEPEPVEVAA